MVTSFQSVISSLYLFYPRCPISSSLTTNYFNIKFMNKNTVKNFISTQNKLKNSKYFPSIKIIKNLIDLFKLKIFLNHPTTIKKKMENPIKPKIDFHNFSSYHKIFFLSYFIKIYWYLKNITYLNFTLLICKLYHKINSNPFYVVILYYKKKKKIEIGKYLLPVNLTKNFKYLCVCIYVMSYLTTSIQYSIKKVD